MSLIIPENIVIEMKHPRKAIIPSYARINIDGNIVHWYARKHRKGKSVVIDGQRIRHPDLFRYYDVSWWTAFLFLVGSCAWVVNGASVVHQPRVIWLGWLTAISAFIGGSFFIVGGYSMYLEALNRDKTFLFNEAIRRTERNFVWRWWGWDSLLDINFSANFSQFLGTIVFYIAVISGLVFVSINVNESDEFMVWYIVFYWIPQVIGAFFLIISSYLLMIESQHNWWQPRLLSFAWHVGFWNILGSIGFFLSGVFGLVNNQSIVPIAMSTYLGSWSFTLGSFLQYLEACDII